MLHTIVPNLWFDTQAEEAAQFYCTVFANSRVTSVTHYTQAGPGDPGSVMTVEFELDAHPFVAINGGPQFTYVSLDDYRIVLDQLTGNGTRSTRDRVAVPHVVFTTPPLARVGLTATEAAATGRPLRTAVRRVADMATVPRARIVGDPRGVMKAITDARTGEILGVTLLAHDAHETINTVAVAMRHGATAASLRDGIYTHPTMTESLNDLFADLV